MAHDFPNPDAAMILELALQGLSFDLPLALQSAEGSFQVFEPTFEPTFEMGGGGEGGLFATVAGLATLSAVVSFAVHIAVAWCVFIDAGRGFAGGRAPLFPPILWGLATLFVGWPFAVVYAALRFGPWWDFGRRSQGVGAPAE